jgi:hypothetical protein
MKIKKVTLVRLAVLVIGIFGAISGLPFGFSNGRINLSPIPGLSYANPLSGIVIGTLGFLIAAAEMGELYYEYKKNFKTDF